MGSARHSALDCTDGGRKFEQHISENDDEVDQVMSFGRGTSARGESGLKYSGSA
jgi:hypothetical protein